jgi:hypothetical protein
MPQCGPRPPRYDCGRAPELSCGLRGRTDTAKAVAIGPCVVGEHERVPSIGLGACGPPLACLRTDRALRVPKAHTQGRGKKFVTSEIMVTKRPAKIEDRAVPGPLGRRSGTQPRVRNGPPLAGHGAEAVRDEIARVITTLPEQLCRSLTWDQGATTS